MILLHLQKEKNLIISFFEISLIFQFSTNFIINDSSINQSATNSSITSNERDLTTRVGKEKKKNLRENCEDFTEEERSYFRRRGREGKPWRRYLRAINIITLTSTLIYSLSRSVETLLLLLLLLSKTFGNAKEGDTPTEIFSPLKSG